MSLSNMTLRGMEHYGGIDLKKNFKKYFSGALGFSIGVHLLILLLYLGWVWFTAEDDKKIPRIRIKSLSQLAPPPSVTDDIQQAVPLTPPPPGETVKPNFGIPIPVPAAVDVADVMPDLNNIPVDAGPGEGAGVIDGTGDVKELVITKPVEEADPGLEDFVSVEVEPAPVKDIQSLVNYPEIAKRAGIEGKVTYAALIGKDGRVEKIEIVKSDNDFFANATKEAVMKAKFTPARQNGEPVKVWYTQTIDFKLNTR